MTTQNWKTVSLEELATLPPGTPVLPNPLWWEDSRTILQGKDEMKELLQEMADDLNEGYRKAAEEEYLKWGIINNQGFAEVHFNHWVGGWKLIVFNVRTCNYEEVTEKYKPLVLESATKDENGEWLITLKERWGRKKLFLFTYKHPIGNSCECRQDVFKEWRDQEYHMVWDHPWSRGKGWIDRDQDGVLLQIQSDV